MALYKSALALFASTCCVGAAYGQATAASGSVLVIPVAAATTSYTSEVTVRNPGTSPITLSVDFHEATGSAAPGLRTCAPLVVAANESKPFQLADQCTLGGGSHFGLLILEDAAAQKTNLFYAYSRSQTPGGNGFSVEGFPIGAFSGALAEVIGLKRQAAAPVYQSNCFVSALGEALSYQVALRNGTTGAPVGSPMTGSLQPFEQVRLFDVGASAGDFSNVRATFTVTSGNQALVGFCTVQESTFFGADFRIAKSEDASNQREKRLACIGQDDCGGVSTTGGAEQIANTDKKNVYSMIITQPDYVRCDVIGARAADLQIRLREWGDPFSSPVFSAGPGFTGGGTGQSFFYVYTGERAAVNNGTATRWFIDVAYRTGGNATTPIDFGITCQSGNGTEVPWLRGIVDNDFF
jgi:hypothetical protein